MKVFVSGGGGFLGQAIVKQLVEEAHEVISYSRSQYEALEKLGVIHQQGSLTDYESLKKAMWGCEAVFHAAAKTGIWGSYESFYEANVIGTENILRACLELKIPYLIYTSSPSVVYDGGSEGKDESMPYPPKFDAYYPETKAIAEKMVLDANGASLISCSLRPHLIWGVGDPHFLPRLLEKRRKDKLRVLGTEKYLVDTTYVDNAAKAHLQAFDAMRTNPESVAGKAYFLSDDEPIAIRTFIDRILASGGLGPVEKSLHPQVALFAGHLLENTYRLLGIKSEPPITPFLAKQLSTAHWYDISAAKRDFGYEAAISIDEGMRRLKDWLGRRGPAS